MNPPIKPDFDRIDAEAARWTALLNGGEMSATQQQELDAWLAADAAHRRCFARYQFISVDTSEKVPALAKISPVAVPEPPARRARQVRAWSLALGGIAAAAVVGFITFRVVPAFHPTRAVATAPAQRQTLTLSDGSRADLNAHTIVSTDFRDGRRHVRLDRGEALFSVAKDPSHPFFVETPTGQIRVTGTVFNVRLAHGGRLEVTVLEGSVSVQATEIPKTAVTTPSEPFRLRPGEQLTLAPEAPQVRTLSPTDLENILAWKQGRIVFEAMPLLEAAARFEEFHERTIAVAPEVATLRLSGSYSLDNLESFFGALAEALPVLVASQPDGSFRINPR